jgi:hypothetical protein
VLRTPTGKNSEAWTGDRGGYTFEPACRNLIYWHRTALKTRVNIQFPLFDFSYMLLDLGVKNTKI